MASLPSARCVRVLKIVVILCPVMTIVFGLLFTMSIAITYKHEKAQQNPRSWTNRRKHPETLQELAERTGVCNYLKHHNVHSNDSLSVTLDNGSNFILNASLISICVEFNKLEESYYKPHKEQVNPFIHKFLINGSDICDNATEVIVLVHSLHTYYDRRKAIRETWGGAIKRNKWPGDIAIGAQMKLAFVFGIHKNKTVDDSIKKESSVYNDIIQGDFFEDYHNMTLKSLLGLKWVNQHCSRVKYLLKSDDDMIINIPYLNQVLMETNMTWFIMGPFNRGSKVLKKGKWSIPHEKYPFYFYPPYESGSAYVISSDLILPLYELSEYVQHIFIDDVYITGILGKILKVRHVTHSGFAYWVSKRPIHCDLVNNRILTGTKMRPSDLWKIWIKLTKQPHICDN